MKTPSRITWEEAKKEEEYPKLSGNEAADVIVIGAGMAGILSAYELSNAGKKVVMLERDQPLNGATNCTTAFITEILDTDPGELEKAFGAAKARAIYDSHRQAIALIEEIVKKEKIGCDFMRCSNYVYANSKDDADALEGQQKDFKKVGIESEVKHDKNLGFSNFGYLEIKDQAKFHPMKFLDALLAILEKNGVKIYGNSAADKIDLKDNSATVHVGDFKVTAPYALTATYHPWDNPWQVFMKKGMYVSFVLELEVKKGLYPEGTFEDMDNPYHYIRIDRNGAKDRVIIGGEDHRKELQIDDAKSFTALKEYAQGLFGDEEEAPIVSKWWGPILEPSDGLALIGEARKRELIATAFSGNGMTYSVIAAKVIAGIVGGKSAAENPWAELYDPKRIPTIDQLAQKGLDYSEELIMGGLKNAFHPADDDMKDDEKKGGKK